MTRRRLIALALFAAPVMTGCALDEAEITDSVEYENLNTAQDALSVFQWSEDKELSTPPTKDAPALATYRGLAHLVQTGHYEAPNSTFSTDNALYHSTFDGSEWSTPNLIPHQYSQDRPALAPLGAKGESVLHMVHLGDKSHYLYWSFFDGSSWQQNSQLAIKSWSAPVMTSFDGKLHLFVTTNVGSPTGNFNLSEWIYDGVEWTLNPTGTSTGLRDGVNGVGVTTHDGSMVLVTREANNKLFMSTSTGNGWSTFKQIPGQLSKSAPALASFQGTLHLTHLGDTSDKIWWSTWDGTDWRNNVTIPGQSSRWVPALTAMGSMLVQAHIGDTYDTLWYSTFE